MATSTVSFYPQEDSYNKSTIQEQRVLRLKYIAPIRIYSRR